MKKIISIQFEEEDLKELNKIQKKLKLKSKSATIRFLILNQLKIIKISHNLINNGQNIYK